jgi:hypothetical protein
MARFSIASRIVATLCALGHVVLMGLEMRPSKLWNLRARSSASAPARCWLAPRCFRNEQAFLEEIANFERE